MDDNDHDYHGWIAMIMIIMRKEDEKKEYLLKGGAAMRREGYQGEGASEEERQGISSSFVFPIEIVHTLNKLD